MLIKSITFQYIISYRSRLWLVSTIQCFTVVRSTGECIGMCKYIAPIICGRDRVLDVIVNIFQTDNVIELLSHSRSRYFIATHPFQWIRETRGDRYHKDKWNDAPKNNTLFAILFEDDNNQNCARFLRISYWCKCSSHIDNWIAPNAFCMQHKNIF